MESDRSRKKSKKAKKNKQEKDFTNFDNQDLSSVDGSLTEDPKPKLNKKQRKSDIDSASELNINDVLDTSESHQNNLNGNVNNEEDVCETLKKKKKKKSSKRKSSPCNDDEDDEKQLENLAEGSSSKLKKKKRKKEAELSRNLEKSLELASKESFKETLNENHEDISSKSKKSKKKKKKDLAKSNDSDMCNKNIEIEEINKSKKKQITVESIDEDIPEPKSKKKKRSKTCYDVTTPNGISDEDIPKKRKVDINNEVFKLENETSIAEKKHKKKKHKHNKVDTETKPESIVSTEQTESKKQKTKISETDSEMSVAATTDTGNSQKTRTDSAVSNGHVNAGQWQGELFDDSQRQNKFLRLLGGMKKDSTVDATSKDTLKSSSNKLFKPQGGPQKKGLFGSLVAKSTGGAAMSASTAAELNRKLEENYNQALGMKLNGKRGSGFGFVPDPGEGKKFHIDVNKTKSIQFDD